jgi:acetoin utilization deacetylase AcuC-like enzyme
MRTAFLTHDDCHGHVTKQGHPERVDRLIAVLDGFTSPEFDALERRSPPLGDTAHIARVHPESYIEMIQSTAGAAGDQPAKVDPDTSVVQGSWKATLRGVGANVEAVNLVMSGEVDNAFCAVRPPGHHAETERAMGFCLFNNVAIAARYAMAKYDLKRVAIVDFDVHHGNGTQEIFERDPNVLFVSSHQMPLYPGTGEASEKGVGNILNCPLPMNADGKAFREVWENQVFPKLEAFRPEFLFISAGFDGHQADPLANINLTEDDFIWVTERLKKIAQNCCQNRIVSTLEGGYDLDALKSSAMAHVRTLMLD